TKHTHKPRAAKPVARRPHARGITRPMAAVHQDPVNKSPHPEIGDLTATPRAPAEIARDAGSPIWNPESPLSSFLACRPEIPDTDESEALK
ncbi:hypothetical protein, partial [Streptomyces atriruber]|uniref:hypothetical protein n=1 Tax=Streptomyces atriruber TaxID=545121 RepID=UPI001ABF21CB